jgi:hypothetical protein
VGYEAEGTRADRPPANGSNRRPGLAGPHCSCRVSIFSPEGPTNFQSQSPTVLPGRMRRSLSCRRLAEVRAEHHLELLDHKFECRYYPDAPKIVHGPGTFNIDADLMKSFPISEARVSKPTSQVFNVTNARPLDMGTMNWTGNTYISNVSDFGNFSSTLSDARVMESTLPYNL